MKKTVITMSICLISLILLIIIKDQYSYLLLKDANYGMPALIEMGEVDNLFIGTSTFRQGLDIGVLESELYGTSYILTYNGNQPVLEYIQLKKLIDNGVKIKNLYFDMYAYTLCREPWLDDEKLLMELTLPEKTEIYSTLAIKSPKVFWQTYVSANNEQILTWPVNKRILNSQFRNGGTLIQSEGLSGEAFARIQPIASDGEINATQLNAVKQIILLCRDNDIELTFIETPKAEMILQNDIYKDVMYRYSELLEENNIKIIRYSENIDDPKDYSDGVHLSSEGRNLYSSRLAQRLQ